LDSCQFFLVARLFCLLSLQLLSPDRSPQHSVKSSRRLIINRAGRRASRAKVVLTAASRGWPASRGVAWLR
jgi:hypothetical protein